MEIGLTQLGTNKANVRARAVREPPLQWDLRSLHVGFHCVRSIETQKTDIRSRAYATRPYNGFRSLHVGFHRVHPKKKPTRIDCFLAPCCGCVRLLWKCVLLRVVVLGFLGFLVR